MKRIVVAILSPLLIAAAAFIGFYPFELLARALPTLTSGPHWLTFGILALGSFVAVVLATYGLTRSELPPARPLPRHMLQALVGYFLALDLAMSGDWWTEHDPFVGRMIAILTFTIIAGNGAVLLLRSFSRRAAV